MSEERKPLVLKVDSEEPEIGKIRIAADVIRNGGLVAFPTETVYGLGADALNAEAVASIFRAKNRPVDNPLIVHVADREEVYKLMKDIPVKAEELMDFFWPGPLTLVLKKSEIVPYVTTGGLETVALRMPDHRVPLALIAESGMPIAAPSANPAGKPSPTNARHVMEDLGAKVDIILDGGPTRVGVESTVLDLTASKPRILRPGGITAEELVDVLGDADLAGIKMEVEVALSPGMKHKHYAPSSDMIVVEGEDFDILTRKVQELADEHRRKGKRVGIMAMSESPRYDADIVKVAGSRADLRTVARNLFEILRGFDEAKVDMIIVEGVETKGIGLAIMDRLERAAGYRVLRV
ncbi:MAG: L-threonylcarbamoyladenylate synthase [Methanocellales archaeon]|nr:L-threonylcarbamoyladenylate synthase [Methanocellales archaeon]MDD3291478.1 L-threonylcarbamoyladenylate synthase [Methanocellales archaeon]MDD5485015.1 L-threonylcarbamoyladenylate synthase [Methanocellales archaeon]